MPPDSPAKAKLAVGSLVRPDGPDPIAGAPGATVSTVQVRLAAALVLPAVSMARTSNMWRPLARPV